MHPTHPSLSRRALAVAMLSFSAAVFVGCASEPAGPAGPAAPAAPKADASPDALLKRAQAYWDLVKANDSIGAWSYEAASKHPQASLEGYLKKGGITYSRVQVLGVKSIDGDTATLDLDMTYSAPLLRIRNVDLHTEDQWKLIEGVWYHAPPRSGLFPTK